MWLSLAIILAGCSSPFLLALLVSWADGVIARKRSGQRFRITWMGRLILLDGLKKGGRVGSRHSLSQEGKCWVDETSRVGKYARVSGDVKIHDHSVIEDHARISGNAIITQSRVNGYAIVSGTSFVNDAVVKEYAVIMEQSRLGEDDVIVGHVLSLSAVYYSFANLSKMVCFQHHHFQFYADYEILMDHST